MFQIPDSTEYAPFFQTYIGKLPKGKSISELLNSGPDTLTGLLEGLSEERAEKPYAPGKWSVKELIGHMIDTEQIMAYRCLCISRGEQQSLPGFDENQYVQNANFKNQKLSILLNHYRILRQANLFLFKGMDEKMKLRTGLANGGKISARALIAIIAGHELHHINILRDRYLSVI